MSNLANILRTDGQQNTPGLKEIGYFAIKTEVATFPALPSAPSTAAEEVTLSGTFVMESEKYFKKLFSTEGNAKVEGESQGELDNETVELIRVIDQLNKKLSNDDTTMINKLKEKGFSEDKINYALEIIRNIK